LENLIDVTILSPQKPLLSVKAGLLKGPGILGQFGILPMHDNFISELSYGELRIEGGELKEPEVFFISGGYVEVIRDQVTVLVDVVERLGDIDLTRAAEAEKRALERLKQRHPGEPLDLPRALQSLARAKARQALKKI
jgi:F-type H+-transporting ATPase subunit epsilon